MDQTYKNLTANLPDLKLKIEQHLKTLHYKDDDPILHDVGLYQIDTSKCGLSVDISEFIYRGPLNHIYGTTRSIRTFKYWIYNDGFVVHANSSGSLEENDYILYDKDYDTDEYDEDGVYEQKRWTTNETVYASKTESLKNQWSFLEPVEAWAFSVLK